MKLCVINFSGNVGKTTIAAHLLKPRMNDPQVFSVESFNSGIENEGVEDAEIIKGKRFADLANEILIADEAIVDVGASNVETFLMLMSQYAGSHKDYDYYIIPTVSQKKQLTDTISTIKTLSEMGIPAEKIKIVFNRVEYDEIDELDAFASLIGFHSTNPIFTFNEKSVVLINDIFDGLKKVNKTLSELVADKTDFKAIIRDKKTTPKEKDFALNMLALQRLSIGANKNLDAAYQALFQD
jgi:cellulose biosynthesis protein BcsQ